MPAPTDRRRTLDDLVPIRPIQLNSNRKTKSLDPDVMSINIAEQLKPHLPPLQKVQRCPELVEITSTLVTRLPPTYDFYDYRNQLSGTLSTRPNETEHPYQAC